jgi:hypothetical protein
MLNDKDQQFLKQRRWRIKSWPTVGTFMLVVLALFAFWLFWRTPLLVNPVEVASRIEAGTLTGSMTTLMAAILPNVVCCCFLLLLTILLFAFSTFSHERRYMRIIDQLLKQGTDDQASASPGERSE